VSWHCGVVCWSVSAGHNTNSLKYSERARKDKCRGQRKDKTSCYLCGAEGPPGAGSPFLHVFQFSSFFGQLRSSRVAHVKVMYLLVLV
jgi:hypothetical protein